MQTTKMKYIATISFGKDSTVMCDLILKNKLPLDYIIFTDTLLEFPLMYEYKKKIEEYFKSRYNKDIITLKPTKTFESIIFGTVQKEDAKRKGMIKGIPNPMLGMCEWRRDAKMVPIEKWIRKNKIGKHYLYVGFTKDEFGRKMEDKEDIVYKYPLIEHGFTETDCQQYLINQEMENPLYRFFTRTGCAVCPAQSDKAWYEVYMHFPETWEYMKWIEKRLEYYEKLGYKIINKYWFKDFKTILDMEKQFKKTTASLFDFSDEPLKDCFCKI